MAHQQPVLSEQSQQVLTILMDQHVVKIKSHLAVPHEGHNYDLPILRVAAMAPIELVDWVDPEFFSQALKLTQSEVDRGRSILLFPRFTRKNISAVPIRKVVSAKSELLEDFPRQPYKQHDATACIDMYC